MKSHEIIYVIVAKNKGSNVLKEAKNLGIKRGTIIKAKGTVKSKLLNFLALYDIDKEIVIMGADKNLPERVSKAIAEKFEFEKKARGILFTIDVNMYIDNEGFVSEDESFENNDSLDNKSDGGDCMYKMITTIVESGKAQDAIEIANAAGARGATVLHGRGSGTEETLTLFNMEIEPEKEILLIIAKSDEYRSIINALNESLELEKPGHGVLFVQDINQAYGLYDDEMDK